MSVLAISPGGLRFRTQAPAPRPLTPPRPTASPRPAGTTAARPRPAGTAPAPAGTGLTLTRRGRFILLGLPALVLSALTLLALVAALMGALANPANAGTTHRPVDMADYATSVTVLRGDSLWSIAAASDSSRDVREIVAEIVALNELTTPVVQAGQRLFVPRPR